ncbi:MAG: MlaD family protein [Hyphomicrobium sp.]
METKARYTLVGLFTLCVILSIFGFVYWLHNTGGLTQKTLYRIRFENSVSGLLVGSNVLFNGIKVGEVSQLDLNADEPELVLATISIDTSTPIRSDTKVGIDFQGLTGAPVISLSGGKSQSAPILSQDGRPPLLEAPPNAGQTLTQSAKETLKRLDGILSENSIPFHDAIDNISTFSKALARNSDRVDSILSGLEKMTGGAGGKPRLPIYSLSVPSEIFKCPVRGEVQLVVPEPAASMALNSDKLPIRGTLPDPRVFDNGVLADTVPALVQAKIIESLENTQCFKSVTRLIEGLETDVQLIVDIRSFGISGEPTLKADIDLSCKLIGNEGKILGAQIFSDTSELRSTDMQGAIGGLNESFGSLLKNVVVWVTKTSQTSHQREGKQKP